MKKVTVHLPEKLLTDARKATHQGITETIRMGLQLLAAGRAYEGLRALRGKVRFSLSLRQLREDRR